MAWRALGQWIGRAPAKVSARCITQSVPDWPNVRVQHEEMSQCAVNGTLHSIFSRVQSGAVDATLLKSRGRSSASQEQPFSEARPMHIVILINPDAIWGWQRQLAQALAAEPKTTVSVQWAATGPSLPIPVKALLQAERKLLARGDSRSSTAAQGDRSAFRAFESPRAGVPVDLLIDLASGSGTVPVAQRTLRPMYDGQTNVTAAITALMAGRLPFIQVHDTDQAAIPFAALPAVERPDLLSRGLESVFSRLGELLINLAHRRAAPFNDKVPRTYLERGQSTTTIRFFGNAVSGRIRGRIDKAQGQAMRWRIGWRRATQSGVRKDFRLALDAYHWLPDDADHWYADPFVRWHGGQHHVLCEDFVERQGKGVISTFTIAADGTMSKPRVVLERPYHLSYPFLFDYDGQIFMMPETTNNRTLEIYRAEKFPDTWVHHKTIMDDAIIDDATLVQHAGLWWLFCGSRHWQSSSWDALSIYHAPSPFGPFAPHQQNPVVVDARSARPAGVMEMRDGALWRPAQDCTAGYGSGMTLCRVDELTPQTYRQTAAVSIKPASGSRFKGVHTLNFAAGIEVIDAYGPPLKSASGKV
jgi:hypothetical protein